MAEAEMLAASVAMGVHGRRRAGHGENFWQYRQAVPGDPRSAVDWRRSGKSDLQFIREMEWEAAQTVSLWVDDAQSMDYRAEGSPRSKGERAALLALAHAVLIHRMALGFAARAEGQTLDGLISRLVGDVLNLEAAA
jgi:uncharacterized protein (DUF58 family)